MAITKAETRPPPLPISQTCIYKVVGKTCIPIDLYFPPANKDGYQHHQHDVRRSQEQEQEPEPRPRRHPIMLFIHGGGWIGANKSDYSRPLFVEFLEKGFVIAAMDYRLRPETSLEGQLADVRDVEGWLRGGRLAAETRAYRVEVDEDMIVVVGCSAGAHLALLTPKLWTVKPSAILSMYGPTDMHNLPYLQRFSNLKLSSLACTPDVLAAGTHYDEPPTEIAIPTGPNDYLRPRGIMAINLFHRGIVAEFLVRGLVKSADGTLRLPERGSASKEEIDAISPLHLTRHIAYPPVYQLVGSADDVFDTSHSAALHVALTAQRVPSAQVLVPGVKHAFDSMAPVDGLIHRAYLAPAVAWVARYVEGG